MLIHYCTDPLSITHSYFSHSYYSSAIHNIVPLSVIRILRKRAFTYLPYSFCQVPSQEIRWLHNLVYQLILALSVMSLIYFFTCFSQSPHISIPTYFLVHIPFYKYSVASVLLYWVLLIYICLKLQEHGIHNFSQHFLFIPTCYAFQHHY